MDMLKSIIIILQFFAIFYLKCEISSLNSAIKTHKPIPLNNTTYQCYNNEDFLNNYRPRRDMWKSRKIK